MGETGRPFAQVLIMADLDASVTKRKPEESDAATTNKRLRHDHEDDDGDADTVSEIAEHSDAGSNHSDELDSEPEAEEKHDDQPSNKRYAPFRLADDKKSIWVRCLHCQTKFVTDLVETLIKPVDVEVEEMDEIDGGHLALRCNVIFKRRTLVRCSECDRDIKIANNAIDHDAGEVLGETIRAATQDSGVLVQQLITNITSVERKYTQASLSRLFGASQ